MYIIIDDQVQRLITMGDAIETMRFALTEHGRRQAKIQSRVRTRFEASTAEPAVQVADVVVTAQQCKGHPDAPRRDPDGNCSNLD
jgi:ornithine cyclodeaminase/alanine dehydrogenase-like protein (mu-crystallin family)